MLDRSPNGPFRNGGRVGGGSLDIEVHRVLSRGLKDGSGNEALLDFS